MAAQFFHALGSHTPFHNEAHKPKRRARLYDIGCFHCPAATRLAGTETEAQPKE
jgi:hypothetical protein